MPWPKKCISLPTGSFREGAGTQVPEGECERELLPSRQSLSTSLGDGGNGRFVNRPYSKAKANTTKEKKEQLSCTEIF